MGQRGPKKKPAATKKAQGTYRADRDAGPEVPPGLPTCPTFLSKAAKELWPALGKLLVSRAVLTTSDQLAFALLCQAWADWQKTIEALAKEGLTCEAKGGAIYQHPLVGMRNRAWLNVMKGCQEFGLTPSARCGWGLESTGGDDAELSPAEKKILGIK